MCVNQSRSSLLSRSAFLGAASAAALPLLASANEVTRIALVPPRGLSAANERAARLAATSPRVAVHYASVHRLVASIGDARLRDDVFDLLDTRVPRYMARYPTTHAREALRDELAREGFVKATDSIAGLFPLPEGERALPFWAAPGSETGGHHSYPGGLCAHELFNATMGEQFTKTYDALYFDGRRTLDRDVAIGAALYHDIMKTVVFQFRSDGTFFSELSLAGTGAHHVLSGAEAIVRGRDARFVVALLSAHAAPSLGDEAKVVMWCRAAARIAGVDAVEFGLVKRDGSGYTLASPPRLEAFVNHLSDHDFVLSIPASKAVEAELSKVAPRFGIAASGDAFAWWRHEVLARTSSIALYQELTNSEDAFMRALQAVV